MGDLVEAPTISWMGPNGSLVSVASGRSGPDIGPDGTPRPEAIWREGRRRRVPESATPQVHGFVLLFGAAVVLLGTFFGTALLVGRALDAASPEGGAREFHHLPEDVRSPRDWRTGGVLR